MLQPWRQGTVSMELWVYFSLSLVGHPPTWLFQYKSSMHYYQKRLNVTLYANLEKKNDFFS